PSVLLSRHTLTSVPAAAVPVIVWVVVLTLTSPAGSVTMGVGGVLESWVMVGMTAAGDTLPTASRATALKLLAAPGVRTTVMRKFVSPADSCCTPATVSPPSIALLLLRSLQTSTRALASAVPTIVMLVSLVTRALAGLVIVGAAGAAESSVMVGTA